MPPNISTTPSTECAASPPLVPVSIGELLDKFSILRIKERRFADADRRADVQREIEALRSAVESIPSWEELIEEIEEVNERLWDAVGRQHALREKARIMDLLLTEKMEFFRISMDVCSLNHERFLAKEKINEFCGSVLRERKEHK